MSAVSEIMSSRKIVRIDEKSKPSLLDIARLMLRNKIGSVVIVRRTNIPVGIVTERDILRTVSKAGKMLGDIKAKDVMSSPVVTVKAYDSVETAAAIMSRKKIKRLVVVEQDGSMSGVLSLTDITRKLAKILTDEHNRYSGLRAALDL